MGFSPPAPILSFSDWLKNAINFYTDDMGPNIKTSLILVTILAIVLIIAGARLKKRDPLKKTTGFLFLCEILVNFINGFAEENIGPRWKRYAPLLLTFAIYIFLANIIGLFGLSNPTANIAITLALGIVSGFVIQVAGIRESGLKNYLKSFLDPTPIMLPLNVISELLTPFSLGMRLFGNILSGSVILSIIYTLLSGSVAGMIIGPFITPVFHAIFDIFFGFIQTYVFILLTAVLIVGKMPEAN